MVRLREYFPAAVVDFARTLREKTAPSRRELAGQRRSVTDDLALLVSPDLRVLAGPFAGLRLPAAGSWGGLAARLAGAYEEEIAASIEQAIAGRPNLVIDAGAAEGYYAVGLARRLPEAQVIAYEIEPEARRVCKEVVAANRVTNVRVRGRVTARELRRRLSPGALVVCDVEGYERELLDPQTAPALLSAQLIVELHEFAAPGVSRVIIERFSNTHCVELVGVKPRTGQRPQLAHLDEATVLRAMDEGRPVDPPMQWAVITPRGDSRARPS